MIVGFELQKINVERKGNVNGNVRIKHNFTIDSVKELTLERLGKRKSLDIGFTFQVDYEPHLGVLTLTGSVLYLADDAALKKIMNTWDNDKKLPMESSLEIINNILSRCNIKSLQLAEDLNLPYHMPLPKVESTQTQYREYIG